MSDSSKTFIFKNVKHITFLIIVGLATMYGHNYNLTTTFLNVKNLDTTTQKKEVQDYNIN